MLALALPAAVWLGAAYEELFVPCDWECGDRRQGWFFGVMATAPLIPLGVWRVATGVRRAGAFTALLRLACLLATACFGLLGLSFLALAAGLLDEEPALFWLWGMAWCFGLVVLLLLARRRLPRRYPSGSWPRSDRSTSAG